MSDDHAWKSEINEAPKRGSFLSSTGAPGGPPPARHVWQCPLCSHFLTYTARTRDAAEMAANSHVSRLHTSERALVILLPDDEPGGGSGSVSVVWQCPFCDVRLKLPDIERTTTDPAIKAHLGERHRLRVHAAGGGADEDAPCERWWGPNASELTAW